MADPNTEEAGPDSEESTQESMHTSTPFASQQAADSGLSSDDLLHLVDPSKEVNDDSKIRKGSDIATVKEW